MIFNRENLTKIKKDFIAIKKKYKDELLGANFTGIYFIHWENNRLCFVYDMNSKRDSCYFRHYELGYGFRESTSYKERILDCKILNKEEADVEIKKLWQKILDQNSKEFIEKIGVKNDITER